MVEYIATYVRSRIDMRLKRLRTEDIRDPCAGQAPCSDGDS
jgi:hypothetical protein